MFSVLRFWRSLVGDQPTPSCTCSNGSTVSSHPIMVGNGDYICSDDVLYYPYGIGVSGQGTLYCQPMYFRRIWVPFT